MIHIQKKLVGTGQPCFIIAEAGSNHNKDKKIARELIKAAADAGADAVKFQLFQGEKHYSRKTPAFKYLKAKGINKNIVDLLKDLELPPDWLQDFRDYAKKCGIILFSSVTSIEDIDVCMRLKFPALKLASFELVDLHLIAHAAKQQKPLILSTGLADMGEIEDAVRVVFDTGNRELILLQCASVYPAPAHIMNLKAMDTLAQAFGVDVGLSDHTQGIHMAPAAVARGARVIEKHFTLSRKMPGPDHAFSVEPAELALMVKHIREVESALGTGIKGQRTSEEAEMYDKARRSIHAATKIPKGTVLKAAHLTVKRPGYGIKPKLWDTIIGRSTKVDIDADEAIRWETLG